MAPAMHKRPRPLRSSDFGQPVITVIGIALQEASVKAMQELLRERAAAVGATVVTRSLTPGFSLSVDRG